MIFTCRSCESTQEIGRNATGQFCSLKCQRDHTYTHKTLPRILAGKAGKVACRRFVIERDGYECRECEISEWNGKEIVLHLDHIDGDSDNNLPANLRLLCPNCHSQTDTFCMKGRTKKAPRKQTKRNQYLRQYQSGPVAQIAGSVVL